MNHKKDDTIDALYLKQIRHFGTLENEVIPKLTAKMKELEETSTEENRKTSEKIKGQISFSIIGHMTDEASGTVMVSKNEKVYPLQAQGWNAFAGN